MLSSIFLLFEASGTVVLVLQQYQTVRSHHLAWLAVKLVLAVLPTYIDYRGIVSSSNL